ncbi:hypothetical protein LJK88_11040 [Paenibacillus sp. P26]|nr:hypothetical protein LJK88_11040 [Paenibacillus sp. P26]
MGRKLEKIYVVFKTHFDIGFTGLVSDVVERYRTEMLRDVNSICEQTESNPPGKICLDDVRMAASAIT